MRRTSLALADFGCQVGNSLLTGQREEAGLGLYYYGARWYDPALGRFIQPDTIVPNPGDAQSFDRYAYVFNNPLRYNDPTGHAGNDVAIHDSNDGPPRWLPSGGEGRLAAQYQALNVDWAKLPGATRAILEAHGYDEESYSDPGVATAQTGFLDPATVGASVFGIGRLVFRLPMLLGFCVDDGCEAEYRTYEMAVRRVDPGVSLQKMAGVVSDSLRHAKGFHINTAIRGAELGLQPGKNGTILIRALGETKVNPGDYIESVRNLLTQQQDKVFAQLSGIISTHPNTWVASEAQQLINIIKQGNFTVVAQ